ncbi:MAG: histone deacetylase [Chloroflexi bacterium]|nr:histone deacetylase [Chloroflexota bacterium]
MKAYYTDHYVLPLPPGHRFPMSKYARLRQAVAEAQIAELLVPDAASDEQLLRVHDAAYVQRMAAGQITPQEMRRIGFPWSPQTVERSRRSSGGTIAACRAALSEGIAVNLAGGTHHACRDHGEGFCIFNDSAVAARAMQAEGRAQRVLIIDCDVHQGNGTADCLQGDASVFTFSIHAEKNFPFRKIPGDLDIGLPNGTEDAVYLETLDEALRRIFAVFYADLAIYLAGADPYVGDRLGYLALSMKGLAQRDSLVFERCRAAGLPVAVAMASGYAPAIDDIVAIHLQTVKLAAHWASQA